jgi:hypothetical protein
VGLYPPLGRGALVVVVAAVVGALASSRGAVAAPPPKPVVPTSYSGQVNATVYAQSATQWTVYNAFFGEPGQVGCKFRACVSMMAP